MPSDLTAPCRSTVRGDVRRATAPSGLPLWPFLVAWVLCVGAVRAEQPAEPPSTSATERASAPGDSAQATPLAEPDSTRTTVADRRVALVIGNATFRNTAPLRNPVHDSEDVAQRLRSLGFEVIERHDLQVREIGPTLHEFRAQLEHAAIGLVFIAGHGLQLNGENYFPAVDAEIASQDDVPMQSLAMGQLLDLLGGAKTRLNLLFLDACRNNPFALGTRDGTRGLAAVNAPSGTVISYATRPGSVANDGKGRNGLYTSELLRQMAESADLPIELVFKRIVAGVKQASSGRQEPWWEGSMEGNFCFRACRDDFLTGVARVAASPAPTAPPVTSPPFPPKRAVAKPAPPKPVTTPVAVAVKDLEPLWFNRSLTRTETGRVYRLESDQAWQVHARTLAGNGGISSIAESPSGELYECDSTEGRILRIDGAAEVVAYQHSGPVKHLAFGPAGRFFFSSVVGSRTGGTIYELKDSKALPFYTVAPESLPEGWAGTFAFDRAGMLWLSSGPAHPAHLYRTHAHELESVYTSSSGGVLGFSFLKDGSIIYADGAHAVFRVTLPALRVEKLFESPFEGTLTDVKPARVAAK